MANPETDPERSVMAFRERWRTDRAAGRVEPLAHYLSLWPEAETLVAREYLALGTQADAGTGRELSPAPRERIGPFELQELVGRGGQGQVWRALDVRLNRVVALKVLSGLGPGAETQVRRFRREAAVASRLDHPGICAVHDAGIDGGVPWIAMRYVEGETLAQRIAAARTIGATDPDSYYLSFGDASAAADPGAGGAPAADSALAAMSRKQVTSVLEVFERAAAALYAAHEAGIVHRDVKPGNIMVTVSGDPVILDFGLAWDGEHDDDSLTRTGEVFGTPAYMSPEQAAGSRIDRRSDVWSLGVSLYECLTLRAAFEAPTRQALYQAILTREAADPRRFNRALPGDLRVVLETAMAKDRDRRYQSAAAFAADLRAMRLHEPIAARPVGVAGRCARWARRNPARATLALALALGVPLVTGLGGFIYASLPDLEAQRQAARADAVEGHLESGFFELHHGDAAAAGEAFAAALALDPQAGEAFAGRVFVAIKAKDFDGALALVNSASFALDPAARAGLEAAALAGRGSAAEADRVLAAAPPSRSALAHFVLAGIEMTRAHGLVNEAEKPKAFRHAFEALRRAVLASARPRRVYHFEMAHAAGHAGQDSAPGDVVDAIEGLWPETAQSRLVCGRALVTVDTARSIELLRRSLALRDGPHARRNLGVALAQARRFPEAIACFEADLAASPNAESLNNLASLRRESGDLPGALATYEKLHALYPDDLGGLIGYGLGLQSQGRLDEAVTILRRATGIAPDSVLALSNLGIVLVDAGRPDEAIPCFAAAEGVLKDDAYFWLNSGTAFAQAGRTAEALAAYERGLALDPKHLQIRIATGYVHLRAGDPERARAFFEKVLETSPDEPDGWFAAAEALAAEGEAGQALTHLCRGHLLGRKRADWNSPSDEWIRTTAAAEARRRAADGDAEGARAVLLEALAALPGDTRLAKLLEDL